MRPMPGATCSRAAREAYLPRLTLGLYPMLVACLLTAASCRHDPFQQFDAFFIGAAITGRCNPEITFDPSRDSAIATLGRQAYEQILRDMQAKHPNDPNNRLQADRALKLRTEEVLLRGEQMVERLGCADPEIQERMRKFISGD